MSPWDILGIPRGADTRAVKRAYAVRLKALSARQDPDGFMRLRAAYESAIAAAAEVEALSAPEVVPGASPSAADAEPASPPPAEGTAKAAGPIPDSALAREPAGGATHVDFAAEVIVDLHDRVLHAESGEDRQPQLQSSTGDPQPVAADLHDAAAEPDWAAIARDFHERIAAQQEASSPSTFAIEDWGASAQDEVDASDVPWVRARELAEAFLHACSVDPAAAVEVLARPALDDLQVREVFDQQVTDYFAHQYDIAPAAVRTAAGLLHWEERAMEFRSWGQQSPLALLDATDLLARLEKPDGRRFGLFNLTRPAGPTRQKLERVLLRVRQFRQRVTHDIALIDALPIERLTSTLDWDAIARFRVDVERPTISFTRGYIALAVALGVVRGMESSRADGSLFTRVLWITLLGLLAFVGALAVTSGLVRLRNWLRNAQARWIPRARESGPRWLPPALACLALSPALALLPSSLPDWSGIGLVALALWIARRPLTESTGAALLYGSIGSASFTALWDAQFPGASSALAFGCGVLMTALVRQMAYADTPTGKGDDAGTLGRWLDAWPWAAVTLLAAVPFARHGPARDIVHALLLCTGVIGLGRSRLRHLGARSLPFYGLTVLAACYVYYLYDGPGRKFPPAWVPEPIAYFWSGDRASAAALLACHVGLLLAAVLAAGIRRIDALRARN